MASTRLDFDILAGMSTAVVNGAVLLVAGIAVGYIGSRIQHALLKEREERDARNAAALRAGTPTRKHCLRPCRNAGVPRSTTSSFWKQRWEISRTGLHEFFNDPKDLSQVGLIMLVGLDQMLYIAKARGISPREEQRAFRRRKASSAAMQRPIQLQHSSRRPWSLVGWPESGSANR